MFFFFFTKSGRQDPPKNIYTSFCPKIFQLLMTRGQGEPAGTWRAAGEKGPGAPLEGTEETDTAQGSKGGVELRKSERR